MLIRKKQKTTHHISWWQSLFDLITQSIISDARSFIQSADEQLKAFVQITIVRSLLILSGFLGFILILIGASRFLDVFFGLPGIGDLFLGSLVLLVSLIVFSLTGSQKKK